MMGAVRATSSPDDPRPFRVLAVCTGNICRSPAVERLLLAGLGPGSGVDVASAGVGAVVGAPMTPEMAALVRAEGVDPDGFVARQLVAEHVRDADLVLALTRRHREVVVGLVPAAVRRTFTLRELGRLADGVDPALLPHGPGTTPADRLRALLPLAAARRGRRLVDPADDDVVDPFGGTEAVYRRAFAELLPPIRTVTTVTRT
jgi:protein-tyrosine phosphatase